MEIFVELSLIIIIAAVITALMRILRQPSIIGYIITGLLVGPYVFNIVKSAETLQIFSQLGITLLLFIVGLNLSPKVIKEVGKTALLTGLGQIVFTTAIGFVITRFFFGWDVVTSLYVALALTFSSTIIILKLLSDKQDLQRLYGRIAVGFLLVQDVVAAFILIGVAAMQKGQDLKELIIMTSLKGVILLVALVLISIYVLPHVLSFFASSQENLFLFSMAWGLGLATLFYFFGFSIEIGALAAGVVLSASPYQWEISAKMKPLRDFFIILFFIMLGSQMAPTALSELIIPALLLSLFVLIFNPLIVIMLMGALGYHKKTSFKAGLTVAQISEFSLILIMLAVNAGYIEPKILSLVTLVGLITIAGSTYLILHADTIYPHFAKILTIFERRHTRPELKGDYNHPVILFGYNRIGFDILKMLKKLRKRVLVIDFDPEVVKKLNKEGVECIYGDADDNELIDKLDLSKVKMAISTIPDFDTNFFLIEKLRTKNKKIIPIVVSHNIEDAEQLYKAGAGYVIMPHFLGGKYASVLIQRFGFYKTKFRVEKEKHLKYLRIRKKLHHEHPVPEQHR